LYTFHVLSIYVVFSHCTIICNEECLPTENEDNECSKRLRPESPTIVEEENLIKESLKGALRDSDDDGDEMWGGLFQKRHKTQAEVVCIAFSIVHIQLNLQLVCSVINSI
jgi:hypothetical protein